MVVEGGAEEGMRHNYVDGFDIFTFYRELKVNLLVRRDRGGGGGGVKVRLKRRNPNSKVAFLM